jgi:amino acid transporter
MKPVASGRSTPQPLARTLGVWGVLFLTLSITTPASSVFIIAPGILEAAGTGALWALALAALVSVSTSYIYAELSSAWPVAGGEYVFVGRTLGPMASFVMLAVNLVSNVLIAPVLALGISEVMSGLVPGLPTVPVAIAVLAGATLIGILNIRLNAAITGTFLAIELAALLLVVWLGATGVVQPASIFLEPLMLGENGLEPMTLAGFGTAAAIAIFALNGPGCAIYFGEEMHESARQLSRAILASSVLAILCIGLPVLAAMAGSPDLSAFLNDPDPFGSFVNEQAGPLVSSLVAGGVVLAIVNAIIASLLACARFLYGSARDRSWNLWLDEALASVHPRFGSPWLGTLLVGSVMILCCFLPLSFLLVLSGAGLIVIYGGVAAASLAARARGLTASAPYKMPLFPLPPVVTLAGLAVILWATWLDEGEGRLALLATLAQILGALAYHRLFLAPRGWKVMLPGEEADA